MKAIYETDQYETIQERENKIPDIMQSPCLREVTQVCLQGCRPTSFPELQNTSPKPISTTSACRQNFIATTASSFFPNTQFTDHESLPPLKESYTNFTKAYPQYSETSRIDRIRAKEYCHLSLSNHVCLDYIGIGLFSHLQLQTNISFTQHQHSGFPLFTTSYKSVNLKSQLLHGGKGSELEGGIRKRIMKFLNISDNDYSMVFTANKSSAFKLVAESYPFQYSKKLLTVYDYKGEAVDTMITTSVKRGARVMLAEFKWPRLRIHSTKLRSMVKRKSKKRKTRGLFVFPLQSRMTGASHSYQWMSMAQENGWHVLLDACALGPKDMDSFGLSLIQPDFLVCSFYKVFGENPTGFGCLLVKKSIISILEDSTCAGIVSLLPTTTTTFQLDLYSSGTKDTAFEKGETSQICSGEAKTKERTDTAIVTVEEGENEHKGEGKLEIECRGLKHVDSLGLMLISTRTRCLINWLINALMKLEHPNTESKTPLVRIYGPKVRFDRGPALAFNLYDWKGEKVEPVLIQKLADRSNISLSNGFLHQIWFADEYVEEKEMVMEKTKGEEKELMGSKKKKCEQGIDVVTAALGFLANFEDVYKLWAFIARFLDADFIEKERWRYTALNQETVEV